MRFHLITLFAVCALFGQQQGAVSFPDRAFLQNAANEARAAAATAKFAAMNASNAAVQAFARKVVEDYTKLNRRLDELVGKKGVCLDINAIPPGQDISELKGADFDRAFVTEMIQVHRKTIAEFEQQLGVSADPDVKNPITSTLPALRARLEQALSLKP
jgi:putative membrane protein